MRNRLSSEPRSFLMQCDLPCLISLMGGISTVRESLYGLISSPIVLRVLERQIREEGHKYDPARIKKIKELMLKASEALKDPLNIES